MVARNAVGYRLFVSYSTHCVHASVSSSSPSDPSSSAACSLLPPSLSVLVTRARPEQQALHTLALRPSSSMLGDLVRPGLAGEDSWPSTVCDLVSAGRGEERRESRDREDRKKELGAVDAASGFGAGESIRGERGEGEEEGRASWGRSEATVWLARGPEGSLRELRQE